MNIEKSYIISEIGNNHNGSVEKAIALIDASKDANVDAVKFQSFRGLDIVSPLIKADEYKGWDAKGFEYWYQFLDSITLKLEDHQKVIDYTLAKGLDFITTPTSPYIVEYLEKLSGIKAYKIASMDLNNIPLIKAVAKTKKEVLMSTGMGSLEEIAQAVEILKDHHLSVLHCISDYPADPSNSFLNNITELRRRFPDLRIGFSDHSLGHELCIAARCLGATLFEKHITLDRKDPAMAEHHFALEPDEFKTLVTWLKHIDQNLNTKGFHRSESEIVNKSSYRRSYRYNKTLKRGEILSQDDLTFIRPGDGIGQDELASVIGQKLKNNVAAFDACKRSDLE